VLEEPEQGIADQVVILVVDVSGIGNESEIQPLPRELDLEASFLLGSDAAVTLPHSARDPGKLYIFADGAESGYNPATASIQLQCTVFADTIINRASIADQDEPPFSQQLLAQLNEVATDLIMLRGGLHS
jgi:hypothetical protein